MSSRSFLLVLAGLSLARAATAQVPVLQTLPGTAWPTDVTVVNGEPIVVGLDGANGFRWTPTGGMSSLGAVLSTTFPRISGDGATVVANTSSSMDRASYWTQATGWIQLPGMGGASGTTESSAFGVNGDGTVIVGSGYVVGSASHAFRWTASTGMVDLTPPFSQPTSRGADVNEVGDLVVGSADLFNGQRAGARWLNGVKTYFMYGAQYVGAAYATSPGASVVVGKTIFGLPGNGWRWDAATDTVTPLANIPGYGNDPFVADATDDGALVVGGTGLQIGANQAIVWRPGQAPERLHAYLVGLGVAMGAYTDLGTAYAISRDGRVIVGKGAGTAGQPFGWVVTFQEPGVPFCFGDGALADHTTPCPCGNIGATGNGCASSTNANGANLDATGWMANDDVVLHGSGMPATVACIYLQGDLLDDIVFGDGVRCAGGALLRLRTKSNVAGASSFPDSVETVTLSERGGVAPGSGLTRYYQTYYRNAAATFCPPETFNVTNGVSIVW